MPIGQLKNKMEKVEALITKLEGVERKVIRAQERRDMELDTLAELGFDSIEEAAEGEALLRGKLDKKVSKLLEDAEDFNNDWESLL